MRGRFRVALLALAATVVALSGCAMLQDNPNLTRAAVEYGTLKVIEADEARAGRIVELMDDLLVVVSDDVEATVLLLDERIREQIDWSKLSPADSVLVNAVLLEVRDRLEEQISDGLLKPDDRLIVSETLGWIRDMALRYG